MAVARPHEVLRDVLVRMEVLKEGQDDLLVFVGEWEEALTEPTRSKKARISMPRSMCRLTIEALELHRHRHVHVHKCKRVAVEVNFSGGTKRHRFSPATTVGVVTQWARKKFKLDGAAGAEYVLQLCKSHEAASPQRASRGTGRAAGVRDLFDLVKEITPQG